MDSAILIFLLVFLIARASAFARPPLILGSRLNYNSLGKPNSHSLWLKRRAHSHMRLQFVQTAFAASCALSVFYYVYTNIDAIKEKQKVATDLAVAQQTKDIEEAQAGQAKAVAEAMKKQQADIDKGIRSVKRGLGGTGEE